MRYSAIRKNLDWNPHPIKVSSIVSM